VAHSHEEAEAAGTCPTQIAPFRRDYGSQARESAAVQIGGSVTVLADFAYHSG
jgi:hypothetical protein